MMTDEDLIVHMSHPAMRQYIALVRLQVLTPLSLLISFAATSICATMINPSLGAISSDLYPTTLTPRTGMIAIYVAFLYFMQIGYCLLLVLARKEETKNTLVTGVGMSLVAANWVMAFWAIAWVLQLFLISTILLGLLIVILLYANIVLLVYHTPVHHRPFDTLFIHVPLRLFLLLPLNILFWQSLFITLGWSWPPGEPDKYTSHATAGLIVILVTNFLALLVVCVRQEIVWCIGSAWLDASLWSQKPKAASIAGAALAFLIILPVSLVFVWLFGMFRTRSLREKEARRRGPIALPPGDEEVVVHRESNHV